MNTYETMLFILTLFEILILQGFATPILTELLYWLTLNKNRNWVIENIDWKGKFQLFSPWISRFFGAILFLALIACLLSGRQEFIVMIHFASLGFFIFHSLVFDFIRNKIFTRKIPTKGVRSAQLVPRTYSHYISIPGFVFTTLISLFSLTRWFLIRTNENTGFEKWFYLAVLTCAYLSVDYVIRRKPVLDSFEWSEAFRKIEVLGAYQVCLGTSILALVHSFINIDGSSTSFLIFSSIPVFSLLGLLLSSSFRRFLEMVKAELENG